MKKKKKKHKHTYSALINGASGVPVGRLRAISPPSIPLDLKIQRFLRIYLGI